MTAPAAKPIGWIHTRMPVLVPADRWQDWLNPDVDAAAMADTFTGKVSTFPCASPKHDVEPTPAK